MGQRVMKLAKERDASGIKKQDHWTYTYYVRDAQGNVMATYKRTFNEISGTQVTDKLALDETHLYGSSRIGLRDRSQDGIYTDVTYNYTAMNTDKSYHTTTTVSTTHMAAVNAATPERKLGYKAYELVNHLGNVLVTVSDRKLEKQLGSSSTIDYYVADVKSANDYSAFGAPMPGRSYTSSTGYRYGFNTQEKDPEIAEGIYTAEFWEYDSRLGRRWNVDPVVKYWESPYACLSNSPICKVDPNGADDIFVQKDKDGNAIKTTIIKTKDKFDRKFVDGKQEGENLEQGWGMKTYGEQYKAQQECEDVDKTIKIVELGSNWGTKYLYDDAGAIIGMAAWRSGQDWMPKGKIDTESPSTSMAMGIIDLGGGFENSAFYQTFYSNMPTEYSTPGVNEELDGNSRGIYPDSRCNASFGNSNTEKEQFDLYMWDQPDRSQTMPQNGVWKGTTSFLYKTSSGEIECLLTIKWGFTVTNGIVSLQSAKPTTSPSQFHKENMPTSGDISPNTK